MVREYGRRGRITALVAVPAAFLLLGLSGPVTATSPAEWPAGPGNLEAEVERQAEDLGLEGVNRLLDQLDRELEGDLPPLRIGDVIAMLVRRDSPYTFSGFVRAVGARLMRDVTAGSGLLGRLVILALLFAFLENIQSAFARPQTTELAFGACYLVLVIMAVGAFILAAEVCRGVVDRLVDFMQAMLPVLTTLLAGVGAVTTAGLLHPVLMVAVQFIAGIVRDVVLPVVLCAACLDLVSHTFARFRLTALADLLRQAAVLVTGVLLSLFIGLVGVYGAAGSVFDGVAIKAAKFATGALIPFVGKLLADAVEVVAGSSLVLKNVIGVMGAFAVVGYTVFPLLKVLSMVIIFRVAGALVQPLGAGQLVGSLRSAAGSLVLMIVIACSVAVLFLVTLAAVVTAATAVVMVR